MTIEPFRTRDGFPNLRVSRNGRTVTLHSLSPEREAERIAVRFNPDLEWVLVAGVGMGYVPEYLLRNTRYSILVYEHGPEILDTARRERDLSGIENSSRVSWVRGNPEAILSFLDERGIRELNFYVHRPYLQIFPEMYATLEGLLVAYLSRKQINRSTLQRFQKVWLKNILRNSRYYADLPGLTDLDHPFRGKTAVVAGAGPSLSQTLPELKTIRDSVLIISTDTALSMLVAGGIRPDFVVSVDPQDKNAYYLIYAKDRSVPLVIDAAASSLAFEKYRPGPVIATDTAFPAYECLVPYWGEKGKLSAGGSVSTSAFDLARHFGCDPIILVGQDLSFTGKQTHSTNNILEDQLTHRCDRLNTLDRYNARSLVMSDRIDAAGISGRRVQTDRKFLTYRDWFQREIRETKSRVINATPEGLVISGAENCALGEAAARYGFADKPIDRAFRIRKPARTPGSGELTASLARIHERVRVLIPPAKQAEESARQMRLAFHPKKPSSSYSPFLSAMNDFDSRFASSLKELGHLGRLVELTMQNSIEGILENRVDDLSADLIDRWAGLYREIHEGLRFLERMIRKRVGQAPTA